MENQRHLVCVEDHIHYLNCAAKSPLLKSGEVAMLEALDREKNLHLRTSKDFFERPELARSLFGQLVNCRSSQVAFMPAVSYGLSSVLNNIIPQKGQHALTIESEFPSDYLALHAWCEKHGAGLKIVGSEASVLDQGEDWNGNILDSINAETSVVLLSAIHWMHGMKFDLEAIGAKCKEVNAAFLVDGTQAVGAMPLDVHSLQIDALFCAGYKWLFGPYSLGCMFIGERFNNGEPIEQSWMNRTNAQDFAALTKYGLEYTPDAGRYNVGETSNFLLMPVLIAGLEQVKKWDPTNVQAYCEKLNQPLYDLSESIGIDLHSAPYRSNHLLGLNLPENADISQVKQSLESRNVFVSQRGPMLRVSVHPFNTQADIEALTQSLSNSFI